MIGNTIGMVEVAAEVDGETVLRIIREETIMAAIIINSKIKTIKIIQAQINFIKMIIATIIAVEKVIIVATATMAEIVMQGKMEDPIIKITIVEEETAKNGKIIILDTVRKNLKGRMIEG